MKILEKIITRAKKAHELYLLALEDVNTGYVEGLANIRGVSYDETYKLLCMVVDGLNTGLFPEEVPEDIRHSLRVLRMVKEDGTVTRVGYAFAVLTEWRLSHAKMPEDIGTGLQDMIKDLIEVLKGQIGDTASEDFAEVQSMFLNKGVLPAEHAGNVLDLFKDSKNAE